MSFWSQVNVILRECDIILLVVDARNPELSKNKKLDELTSYMHKRVVVIFNKSDLLTLNALKKGKRDYPDAFFVSARKNQGMNKLRNALVDMAEEINWRLPKVGVIGYPNVGKSAIINALLRKRVAQTAQKAGTTRRIQIIKSEAYKIFDTPGVIPYEDLEADLAYIGAKDPEKLGNPDKSAHKIVRAFLKKDKTKLEKFYGVSAGEDIGKIIEDIGRRRGFLMKGGIVDDRKTVIQIIRDWQKGKLRF